MWTHIRDTDLLYVLSFVVQVIESLVRLHNNGTQFISHNNPFIPTSIHCCLRQECVATTSSRWPTNASFSTCVETLLQIGIVSWYTFLLTWMVFNYVKLYMFLRTNTHPYIYYTTYVLYKSIICHLWTSCYLRTVARGSLFRFLP